MGYWAKDGSYVRDEYDDMSKRNPYGEDLRTTGGAIYDERTRNDEAQINAKRYGEDLRATGGATYDERTRNDEAQINAKRYGEDLRATGGATYDERTRNDEAQVTASIERDKLKVAAIQDLLNQLPSNKNELIEALEATDYRLDFIKKLVEGYKDSFMELSAKLKGNYSKEASEMLNYKLEEYLSLIETLKTMGYDFGGYGKQSNYYNPYKPDLAIPEIMDIMQVRRKNEADVSIVFPVDYNLEDRDNQQKGDAVTIINNIDQHLKDNPDMSILWKRAGYVPSDLTNQRSV